MISVKGFACGDFVPAMIVVRLIAGVVVAAEACRIVMHSAYPAVDGY